MLTRHHVSGKSERPHLFAESYDIRIVSVVIGIALSIRFKIEQKELQLKRDQLWQTMAKAASLADTLGEHLKCAVCLDQYTEPKVLPCLHTFCKRCLQGVLNYEGAVWKLICPTCRSSAKVSLNLFEQSFSEGLTFRICPVCSAGIGSIFADATVFLWLHRSPIKSITFLLLGRKFCR